MKLPKIGAAKPLGWLKRQLHTDLHEGFVGNYNAFCPSVNLDLFVKQRITSFHNEQTDEENKEIDNLVHKPWWAGEHEGYWKDGVSRTAYLLDDETYIKKTEVWVREVVDAAERNGGYVGIYNEGSRFNHRGENGELWTQSLILQVLLSFYEFSDDQRVLDTVIKAVDLTFDTYFSKQSYFCANPERAAGGVYHGVGAINILEWLYRLTGDIKYHTYACDFYDDYSNVTNTSHADLQLSRLLDNGQPFAGHTPHITESLLLPVMAACVKSKKTGDYSLAAFQTMKKLAYCTTPSGSFVGDENVDGRRGSGETPYEYCSTTEGLIALNRIISLTGDITLGDNIENMVFNAGFGARLPDLHAVCYLSKDNRYEINHEANEKRFTYAAWHDAASCCTLNAGRMLPYFAEGMWRDPDKNNTITKVLYGPSSFITKIEDSEITITENTDYPFSDDVQMEITVSCSRHFSLRLRKPFGAYITINKGGEIFRDCLTEDDNSVVISRTWEGTITISFSFNFEIKTHRSNMECYKQRGPILYVLPIKAEVKKETAIRNSGYYAYRVEAKEKIGEELYLDPTEEFTISKNGNETLKSPWRTSPLTLKGALFTSEGEKVHSKLVPMGTTILRRLTFPISPRQFE